MAEIGCVSFNAWEMVHGSAVVVIDCDFGKVVGYVLQESVMDICHVSSVFIVLGPKLEFKNKFRIFSWIHNSVVVCMCCVETLMLSLVNSDSPFVAVVIDRIPSTTPGAEPPRDAKDSGSARSHSTHLETSSSNRP